MISPKRARHGRLAAALAAVGIASAAGCAPDLTLEQKSGATGTGGGSSSSGTSSAGGIGGGTSGSGGDVTGGVPLSSYGFGDSSDQTAEGLAAGPDGSVLLIGQFAGSIDFGQGPLLSAGAEDVVVARFDAQGNPIFSLRFGDSAPQLAHAIASKSDGGAVIAGELAGAVDFAGKTISSTGGMDAFLAAVDEGGAPQWLKVFGDSGYQTATAVTIDVEGNILVAGYFSGSIDFGGQPLKSAGGYDGFVAKLDKNGKRIWSLRFGDEHDQRATGIAVDAKGDVLVIGELAGTADLGSGPLTSVGGDDLLVAKIGTEGKIAWAKRFGDAGAQAGRSIAADADGHVVFAGESSGPIDFGGGSIIVGSEGALFVAALDAEGKHVWSKGFERQGEASIRSLAVGGNDAVLLTGEIAGSVDFGGGLRTSSGAEDAFVTSLDAMGRFLWDNLSGDAESQRGRATVMDTQGRAVVAGQFAGSIDLGDNPLMSAGGKDVFLARFTF